MSRARLLGEVTLVLLVIALLALYLAAPERATALAAARDWYMELFRLFFASAGGGVEP